MVRGNGRPCPGIDGSAIGAAHAGVGLCPDDEIERDETEPEGGCNDCRIYPAAEESADPWGEPRLWRAAGDNRHVVGAGEARNNAFRDRAESYFHKASDIRQDFIFKRLIDIGVIAAVIANDCDRSVRPAISHAVKTNLWGEDRCHSDLYFPRGFGPAYQNANQSGLGSARP